MTRIQDQSLLVGHRCQVFHSKQVLRPILEGSSISSIHYQFAGMLRHRIIQVIGKHQHDSRSLPGSTRIIAYRSGCYLIIRTETIHINPSETSQFTSKLGSKFGMKPDREIAQRILQCQYLLRFGKHILTFGRMVYRLFVRFGFRQYIRNTRKNRP